MQTGNQSAFRALADPTRRAILLHLSRHEMTIGDLSDQFEMTRAAVKKHLSVLEEGNLISVRANGRERINKIEPVELKAVVDWLGYFERFWDEKLESLSRAVEEEMNKND